MYSLLYRDKTESQELHTANWLDFWTHHAGWLYVSVTIMIRGTPQTATFALPGSSKNPVYTIDPSTLDTNTDGCTMCTKNKPDFNQQTKTLTTQPSNQPNRHQSISVLGEVLPPADIGLSILLNLLSGIDPSHVVPQLLAASTEIWVSRVPHSQEITKTAKVGVEHLGTNAPKHGEMFIWGYPSQQKETLTPSAGQHLLHQELCRKSSPLQKMGVIGQLQISGRPIWERKQLECRSEILCRPLVARDLLLLGLTWSYYWAQDPDLPSCLSCCVIKYNQKTTRELQRYPYSPAGKHTPQRPHSSTPARSATAVDPKMQRKGRQGRRSTSHSGQECLVPGPPPTSLGTTERPWISGQSPLDDGKILTGKPYIWW